MKQQKDSYKEIIDLTETDEVNVETESSKRKLENSQESINNFTSKRYKTQEKGSNKKTIDMTETDEGNIGNRNSKRELENLEESNNNLTFKPYTTQEKKFELQLINSVSPKFKTTRNKINFFDLTKKNDIKRLVKSRKKQNKNYSYNDEFNKNVTNVKLYLAPVYAINKDRSQYGVFAAEEITVSQEEITNKNKIIAYYAGAHCRNDDEENESSNAIFQMVKKNGQISETIDGEINGDWTSIVNGGQNANVFAFQDDQSRIGIGIATTIKKNQQLILDYAPGYKKKLGDQFRYLNPDDDWRSPEEIYSSRRIRKFYAEGIYRFDPQTYLDLDLDSNLTWLIPSIFIHICQNDIENLKLQLDQGCPPDLLAYACDSNHKISDKQQHLTALMLACYLGRENCISLLLSYGADIDRLMLINGFSPFTLLLIGHANTTDVSKIGLELLKQMYYPFVTDKNDLSLLHYAIKRNSPVLVAELIKIANEENHDFYSPMFSQKKAVKHIDIDACIINSQFDILKILLLDMLNKGLLVNKYQQGLIFKESTFSSLDLDQLKKLHFIFTNDLKTEEKNYLLDALKIYILTLMGQISYSPQKISSSQEIQFLKRMLNFSTNLENLDLFLSHVKPHYFFDKCLSQCIGIDINVDVSPLEFVLDEKPNAAIYVLKHMEKYLQRCEFETRYHLLHNFDMHSCLRLAVKNNLEDVYDGIMIIYQQYDNEAKLITLLLSQAIENSKATPNDHQFLQKLFNDAYHVYELNINEEQKMSLILSFINFCKTKQEDIDDNLPHCKFILDCIEKNYPFKEKTNSLSIALENFLPPAFLCLFLTTEIIDIINQSGINTLMLAIKNLYLQQNKFIPKNDTQLAKSLLNYAKHNNCSPEIVQRLENEMTKATAEKFPIISSLNSTDTELKDMILSDSYEIPPSFMTSQKRL